MATNDPAYMREYKQKHYAANKEKYVQQALARKKQLRDEVWAIKGSTPCMDCGVQYDPWVMHFDHRDDDRNGEYPISRLVNRNNRTKVFEEIEKCDIVCANCHASRTHRRRAAFV